MADWKQIPRITERKCGGWLAVSDPADALQIGVAAATEDAARKEFEATRERWQTILDSGAAAVVAAFVPPN